MVQSGALFLGFIGSLVAGAAVGERERLDDLEMEEGGIWVACLFQDWSKYLRMRAGGRFLCGGGVIRNVPLSTKLRRGPDRKNVLTIL